MQFSILSDYFQKLEKTQSRLAITNILSGLFKEANPDEIGKICYLLLGRVAPLYEAIEFGVADKLMIRSIAKAYDQTDLVVQKEFRKLGDLGIVAEHYSSQFTDHSLQKKKQSVTEVFEKLEMLAKTGGEGSVEKKIDILSGLFRSMDALSARYLARIPLDKMRLGFSDMTILDSLSWFISGDKSHRIELEDAYNVRPDIALLAQTVKERGVQGLPQIRAKVGAPILAALCQRLPTADEMVKKMGKVSVEPKYDGVRIQIHFKKGSGDREQGIEVKTFSRNLENTTAMFPEAQEIGNQLNAHEVILDGEAVGLDPKTGKLVSFQETMSRKRKHDIAQTRLDIPLRFFIFDIMYKDSKDLMNEPLSVRRKMLESTIKTGKILTISPMILTDKAEDVRTYHDKQITLGLEGAVVKKWESPYKPGRRNYSWVKFKEEEGKTGKLTDTVDVVVMGYYAGEGKRTGFGIGAFLVGVKKGDAFVTLTKIGTGVSDDLWKQLKIAFGHQSSKEKPKQYDAVHKQFEPDVWVDPSIVVEIAGDDLTKSPTHGAGFAVRFPRLVRIRTDKSPDQVTTVGEITRMFANQMSAHTQK
jgi:DNA ligase 1